jgi:hypothetical protein
MPYAGRHRLSRCVIHLSSTRWLLLLTMVALSTRLVWAVAMVDRESRFDEVVYLRHAAQLCASRRRDSAPRSLARSVPARPTPAPDTVLPVQ